jgi:hypothetical protein
MLLFMPPLRIPSEVRETDMAFLIPIISHPIPLLPARSSAAPASQNYNERLEQVSGIPAPRWNVPLPVLYAMATANEIWAGIAKRPALISLATVPLMGQERERARFNHEKSERELRIQFRPVEETLSDTIHWYQQNSWLKTPELNKVPLRAAGQRT